MYRNRVVNARVDASAGEVLPQRVPTAAEDWKDVVILFVPLGGRKP